MGQENRPCWFALPLFAGAASATIGFVAAWYGASAGLELSIGAALMLGIVAGIVALGNVSRQTKNAQRSWQLEIERLESQLAAETAAVLLEAGVGALEEIESKRQPGVFLSLFEIDPAWAGQLRVYALIGL